MRKRIVIPSRFFAILWSVMLSVSDAAFENKQKEGQQLFFDLKHHRNNTTTTTSYNPHLIHPALCRGKTTRECQLLDREAILASRRLQTLSRHVGKLRLLVVLVRFRGHEEKSLPRPREFEELFNGEGTSPVIPTGSIRQWVRGTSYGQVDIEAEIIPWTLSDNTEEFYSFGISGISHDFGPSYYPALDSLQQQGFDFSRFDMNGDGRIDGTIVVHSGYAAELGGKDCDKRGVRNRIWSHAIPSVHRRRAWKSRDKTIYSGPYAVVSGLRGHCGNRAARIGVFAHELLHLLGVGDLSDQGHEFIGKGLGNYDVMSNAHGVGGDQTRPTHPGPWSKMKIGWSKPTEITTDGLYRIEPSAFRNQYYQIKGNFPQGEYLLIENRQAVMWDEKLGGSGILIYHVDETASMKNRGHPGQDGWPANGNHYKVSLLSARGNYGLERGMHMHSAKDYWTEGSPTLGPGPIENNATPSGIYPNTNSYKNGIIQQTGISIGDFQFDESSKSYTFRVSGISPVSAIIPDNTFAEAAVISNLPMNGRRSSQFPSTQPSESPTLRPTPSPTLSPTHFPTPFPTKSPTKTPTQLPTSHPTSSPTRSPTFHPTPSPTRFPTAHPTPSPTHLPTPNPTPSPTRSPTVHPTPSPTRLPTIDPTSSPTRLPTAHPTPSPTHLPTTTPTRLPTAHPTPSPSRSPTVHPTPSPTQLPTAHPTLPPTRSPTVATLNNLVSSPTELPTSPPTSSPTRLPTAVPTRLPTRFPTDHPTSSPTRSPTFPPTKEPSPPNPISATAAGATTNTTTFVNSNTAQTTTTTSLQSRSEDPSRASSGSITLVDERNITMLSCPSDNQGQGMTITNMQSSRLLYGAFGGNGKHGIIGATETTLPSRIFMWKFVPAPCDGSSRKQQSKQTEELSNKNTAFNDDPDDSETTATRRRRTTKRIRTTGRWTMRQCWFIVNLANKERLISRHSALTNSSNAEIALHRGQIWHIHHVEQDQQGNEDKDQTTTTNSTLASTEAGTVIRIINAWNGRALFAKRGFLYSQGMGTMTPSRNNSDVIVDNDNDWDDSTLWTVKCAPIQSSKSPSPSPTPFPITPLPSRKIADREAATATTTFNNNNDNKNRPLFSRPQQHQPLSTCSFGCGDERIQICKVHRGGQYDLFPPETKCVQSFKNHHNHHGGKRVHGRRRDNGSGRRRGPREWQRHFWQQQKQQHHHHHYRQFKILCGPCSVHQL